MKNNKVNKVYEVMKGSKLNLHQIKALTGVGNGYKHGDVGVSPTITKNECTKGKKATSKRKKVNLHKIKAHTGAGNGYKSKDLVCSIKDTHKNHA